MAYSRSTSEPPLKTNFGRSENFTGTRVGSSGFSFFVPVEQQTAMADTAPRTVDTSPQIMDQPWNNASGPRNKGARASYDYSAGKGVSSSGDWASTSNWNNLPERQTRSSNYVPPPLKLNHGVSESKKARGGGVSSSTEFPQNSVNNNNNAAMVEPNFYNGYHTKVRAAGNHNSDHAPRYSSAGPRISTGHKRHGIITQKAKPVPGGFRGVDPRADNSRTPPDGFGFDGNQTFEQYQNEVQKNIVNKAQPKKRPFNLEEMQVNPLPCLVVLSVTIETMNRLLGRTPKTDILFEFYGILDSPVNYLAALKAKKFTLRQGRSYINVVYFETDKPMSKVVRNHYMRCVGKWNIKLRAVVAYSARHAKQEEARKSSVRVEQHEAEVEKYFS